MKTLTSAKAVLIVTSNEMLAHLGGKESPERLRAAWRGIDAAERIGVRLERLEAMPASLGELAEIHDPRYLTRLRQAFQKGAAWMDSPDCPVDSGTWTAALVAAGAGPVAVRRMLHPDGPQHAFLAVRPGCHHAKWSRADGFCYLNNTAITARAMLTSGLCTRVGIIDLDNHHGDGTQELLGRIGSCAYASVHAEGFPGTGLVDGDGPAWNWLLPAGTGDEVWLETLKQLLDLMVAWGPDGIVISFGCDVLAGDPVGSMMLTQVGLDRGARQVLERFQKLPTISVLCGGYVTSELEESVRRHVLALAGGDMSLGSNSELKGIPGVSSMVDLVSPPIPHQEPSNEYPE